MEARSKSHPKKFREPVKNPNTRPCLGPAVRDAQWYTPPDEGMEDANCKTRGQRGECFAGEDAPTSAIDAAMKA